MRFRSVLNGSSSVSVFARVMCQFITLRAFTIVHFYVFFFVIFCVFVRLLFFALRYLVRSLDYMLPFCCCIRTDSTRFFFVSICARASPIPFGPCSPHHYVLRLRAEFWCIRYLHFYIYIRSYFIATLRTSIITYYLVLTTHHWYCMVRAHGAGSGVGAVCSQLLAPHEGQYDRNYSIWFSTCSSRWPIPAFIKYYGIRWCRCLGEFIPLLRPAQQY